ncbi:LrgB family protein [Edaphobacter sp. HDX4]|uniref:LrgB family protein n=1 Tax=Edaphobacter sp. HDX4 TaxID=2794064 RepID=UPI002FE51524
MNLFGHPFGISPGIVPLFALVLTIGAYLIGQSIQKCVNKAIANPVLIAVLIIGITLRVCHMTYDSYFSGAQFIHFLLGPATVALAIPLARSLDHMRRGFLPMVAALFSGSIIGLASGYGVVRILGGSQVIALSMVPHSLTTPIAIGVSQNIGGIPSLSAVLAIAGGILVAIGVDAILGWMNIEDPAVRGLAAGVAGSGVGASRVIPQHPVSAAFAGVAIGLNGFITAVLAPVFIGLLKYFVHR